MKGYKVFNSDWTCRDFQYEVGETYELDGELKMCENGFHFCKELIDCFNYYNFYDNVKIAEVEAMGDIIESGEDSKCCTNKIKIVREIDFGEMCEIVGADEWSMTFLFKMSKECVTLLNGHCYGGSDADFFYFSVFNVSSRAYQNITMCLKGDTMKIWVYNRKLLKKTIEIIISNKEMSKEIYVEDKMNDKLIEIVEKLLIG